MLSHNNIWILQQKNVPILRGLKGVVSPYNFPFNRPYPWICSVSVKTQHYPWMWLLYYCSPCLHSAKPKLQRNHQKRLEIFASASNVSAFYTSCLEKRFRSCWLEWKRVSSWWLTGRLRSLPDLLRILPRPQGAFPPYEVLPLQILTGAFPLFFQSHQPTCWLEWDWPCTATGQVPYPAPAIQVKYNRSFPSCLQLKVQEYFLGHWGLYHPTAGQEMMGMCLSKEAAPSLDDTVWGAVLCIGLTDWAGEQN